jgi:hypothetical protein
MIPEYLNPGVKGTSDLPECRQDGFTIIMSTAHQIWIFKVQE